MSHDQRHREYRVSGGRKDTTREGNAIADLVAIRYPDEVTAEAATDEVRRLAVQPGTSALFLMLEKVTPDQAVEPMSKYGGTVLQTSLSKDDSRELQDALHGGETVAR
jgi:uncharacterized membrane protein